MKYIVYVIECHLLYGIMLRYNILSKGLTFQVVWALYNIYDLTW
jgi:hypothetical protein